jgi:hypothetical protein
VYTMDGGEPMGYNRRDGSPVIYLCTPSVNRPGSEDLLCPAL